MTLCGKKNSPQPSRIGEGVELDLASLSGEASGRVHFLRLEGV
jgi:hypothetical protein